MQVLDLISMKVYSLEVWEPIERQLVDRFDLVVIEVDVLQVVGFSEYLSVQLLHGISVDLKIFELFRVSQVFWLHGFELIVGINE